MRSVEFIVMCLCVDRTCQTHALAGCVGCFDVYLKNELHYNESVNVPQAEAVTSMGIICVHHSNGEYGQRECMLLFTNNNLLIAYQR